jgi:hypothetical protein
MQGVRDLAGVLRFRIGGVNFLMVHDRMDVPRDLNGVDVVVYGHSHRYSEETKDGRLWLNPGSCGRARFGGDVTMAKITLQNGRVNRVIRIDFDPENPADFVIADAGMHQYLPEIIAGAGILLFLLGILIFLRFAVRG